jgi:hypothetical protein
MGYSFFLYGVYDEGQKCFPRFQNFITSSQTAYVKGTLFKLACGLPLLNPQGDKMVPGRLVELDVAESHWPIIDAINGYNASGGKRNFLVREPVEVLVHEGSPVAAQTYCLNPERKTQGCQEITDDAVYANFINGHPSLIDRLTERQKTYIQRLSQAKGREIVPVDMALYRELMSLELIVDKGRRLALTHLGQEVSLFL